MLFRSLWRLATQQIKPDAEQGETLDSEQVIYRLNATIKKVTEDLEGDFHFNTAISACMEFLNSLYRFDLKSERDQKLFQDSLRTLILLAAPFIPHVAEELWSQLGNKGTIFREKWPSYDPRALQLQEEEIVVQVSGKVRSRLKVQREITEDKLRELALKDGKVREWLNGKEIKKVVVIPHRLVNVVV